MGVAARQWHINLFGLPQRVAGLDAFVLAEA